MSEIWGSSPEERLIAALCHPCVTATSFFHSSTKFNMHPQGEAMLKQSVCYGLSGYHVLPRHHNHNTIEKGAKVNASIP